MMISSKVYIQFLMLLHLFNSACGVSDRRGGLILRSIWGRPSMYEPESNLQSTTVNDDSASTQRNNSFDTTITSLPRGGALGFPAGYNPFGYALTDFGKQFLDFDGSLESDIGKFLSTFKGGKRKSAATLKEQWLEVVRVSKKGQSMRIYRKLDELIEFCLKAGFID